MTKEQLANYLNGVGYGEITPKHEQTAKDNNLVIVTGASDDIVQFSGAIDDEASTTVYLKKDGIVELDDNFDSIEDQIEFLTENNGDVPKNKIEGVFGDSDSKHTWQFKTEIPHATFLMEDDDDEEYCLGIVFSKDDLK